MCFMMSSILMVNKINLTAKVHQKTSSMRELKAFNLEPETGTEVNPESWTQLKGSHEAQIKFGRETCSD